MITEAIKKEVSKKSHWLRRDSLAKFFLPLIQGENLLDVGCAQGRDSRLFSELGFTVIGLDFEKKFIKEATKKGKAKYVLGNIISLPFEKSYFDIAYCVNTLFYVNEKKALDELTRVLRAGGFLCITLDKRIINLETKEIIYSLDVDKTVNYLEKSCFVTYKKSFDRVDREPFIHKHEFVAICLVKK